MTKLFFERIEKERLALLELGIRNPLLNHRKKAKQVVVHDERSLELLRILVSEGKTMTFLSAPEKDASTTSDEQLLRQPSDDSFGSIPPEPQHVDLKLQTKMESEKLQKRLLSIYRDARTIVEEQGINTLFLAMGFLHWKEKASVTEARRAPLVLIPVELRRSSANANFTLSWTGEDPTRNLSLEAKLKSDFGIDLPDMGFEAGSIKLKEYYRELQRILEGDAGWTVCPNEISLGFFSFGKFLMYNDLQSELWMDKVTSERTSALLALLGDGFAMNEGALTEETHLDSVVLPEETHHVKDADATQALAILDVARGKSLVLEGPPGTGKSQSITNIIADFVGRGKRVLFVAEKMAALEVVKDRLDSVGLGDAVLELHSNKSRKKQVIDELARTLDLGKPIADCPAAQFDRLSTATKRLNEYCDAVNRHRAGTSFSFVSALGRSILTEQSQATALIPFEPMRTWTDSELQENVERIEEIDRILQTMGPVCRNSFAISAREEFLPQEQAALKSSLNQFISITSELETAVNRLVEFLSAGPQTTPTSVTQLLNTAEFLVNSPSLSGFHLDWPGWTDEIEAITELLSAGSLHHEKRKQFDDIVSDFGWQSPLNSAHVTYQLQRSRWWRFFSPSFMRARRDLKSYLRDPALLDSHDILEVFEAVETCQKTSTTIEELSSLGQTAFSEHWRGQATEWGRLSKIANAANQLQKQMRSNRVIGELASLAQKEFDRVSLQTLVARCRDAHENWRHMANNISNQLQLPPSTFTGLSFEETKLQATTWNEQLPQLFQLVQFRQRIRSLRERELGFIAERANNWDPATGSLSRLLLHSYFSGLTSQAYSEEQAIREFSSDEHAATVERFRRLDQATFILNQTRVAKKHWDSIPKTNTGEVLILRREANKKRRHLPIRSLIAKASGAIQAIKPVFMMSPMSIATYLPPGSAHFDLVIFDEASQVKPVDAFGAMLRGNKVVVVGDSKQLPPTAFFDSAITGDDENDEESLGDLESILSLFLAKGAHKRMLRWHYRSRHDSLIRVSNREFYDDRLVVFPSPLTKSRSMGLSLKHLPNTIYEKGNTSTNPLEARAVAEAAARHARETPHLSLGIIAFSIKQRDAIENQIEILRRQEEDLEEYFGNSGPERFFVKNLENVQGDERDVIFISIGYGNDENGKLSQNFGALNRTGGERRLNVLISRAKSAMVVFSNFTAKDLDLRRTNAKGVVSLKTFLQFAETGQMERSFSSDQDPDSPFEKEVLKALRQRGIDAEPQVGSGGFFIDIGIRDRKSSGAFILGIECDGASYHSSRSARDRDRLRQSVLEGLGWKFHRIWSTEWYRNRDSEIERMVRAIESAQSESNRLDCPAPPPETAHPGLRRLAKVDAEESNERDFYLVAEPLLPECVDSLTAIPPQELWSYMRQIVSVESPVHVQVVGRRLAAALDIKRLGSRIQKALLNAVEYAQNNGEAQFRSGFIWSNSGSIIKPRNRRRLPSHFRKMELVAPEEIDAAIMVSVREAFSISTNDTIRTAAEKLGFSRTGSTAKNLILARLTQLLDDELLQQTDDGSIRHIPSVAPIDTSHSDLIGSG